MSRPQTNHAIPQKPSINAASNAAPKPAREAAPFVLVPESLVIDDGRDPEPHWAEAIDSATD
jgi:hypothetical protein